MTDPIVVPYRGEWPEQFRAEADRIGALLECRLSGPVEHIGSTAIPGMPAKPLIDMMAPVADLAVGHAAAREMASLGYAVRPHRIDAVLVVRPDGDTFSHGLHLTTIDSELWRERLLFRNVVRDDPVLGERYQALKRSMLASDQPNDSKDKREFVREVLAGVGHPLRDDSRVVRPPRGS